MRLRSSEGYRRRAPSSEASVYARRKRRSELRGHRLLFRFCLFPSRDVPHWSSSACAQSDQTRQSDSSFPAHDFLVSHRLVIRDHSTPARTRCLEASGMDFALSNSSCCCLGGRNRPWNWERHNCPCHDFNHSRDPLLELDSSRRIPRTNHRRVAFSWMFTSSRNPHDWTDSRHRSHGCTLCHTPPHQYSRAVALLLGDGNWLWVDPSQIGIHRGIDSDARDIQCHFVLVPSFVDGWARFCPEESPRREFRRDAPPSTHLNL